ncbi:MAG: FtsH protease activity modulator HflK, partial [Dongiaceae bacterium]
PDLEELLRRSQDRMKSYIPGGFGSGRGIAIIAAVLVIGWGLTGFYTVQPDEMGVPLVFGKAQAPTSPGFHWNFPAPIGHVEKPKVAAINRLEIGGRSDSGGLESGSSLQAESLMLTGDENIIDIHFNVQWQISDPNKFLFEIFEPETSIKNAAEAAMREVIGQTSLERALSGIGRKELETRTLEILQRILDSYGAGVTITQVAAQRVDAPIAVVEAFRDVQAAAADKVRAENEAQADFNRVTQQAEGEAQQIIKEAEAYRDQKIAIATGDANRFLAVYEEYKQAKTITERRIYLETMEEIMQKMRKVLIDTGSGSGAVPYLPLDQLLRQQAPPAATQSPGSAGASQ